MEVYGPHASLVAGHLVARPVRVRAARVPAERTTPSLQNLIPEQFTVKAQEPLIPTRLYKMVASMEATRRSLPWRLPSLIVSVTRCKTAKAIVRPFIMEETCKPVYIVYNIASMFL